MGALGTAPAPGRQAVLVGALDRWDRAAVAAQQETARAAGLPYLHCRLEGPLGVVGPIVRPDQPGCVMCAEWRRLLVIGRTPAADLDRVERRPARSWPGPMLDWLAGLILRWALEAPGRPGGVVHFQQLRDGSGGQHRFLPVADCPGCSAPPAHDSQAVERQPWDRDTLRVTELLEAAVLKEALYDWRLGVFPHVFRDVEAPVPTVAAEVPVPSELKRQGGVGRAWSFESAESVAYLEGLERWAGFQAHGRGRVVVDTLRNLGETAVDPARFGLLETPVGQGLYSPDLPMSWVPGWSYTRGHRVYVPEQFVYYMWVPEPRFVYDTSNGCALGSTVAEATIHGLFEVAERDAFLLTWYGRLAVPRIDLGSCDDPQVALLLDRAEALGYSVRAYDTTSDLGIPAVWALLETDDPDRPASFTAGGANPDPVTALRAALLEVVVQANYRVRVRLDGDRAQLARMLEDGDLVRKMDDHIALYTLPEATSRFSFLDDSGTTTVEAMRRRYRPRWLAGDPDTSLRRLAREAAEVGVEVISVDQTTPEVAAAGFRSVKVLAPGTLPMVFGHAHRRLRGIPRLLEAPVRMGHWERPRTFEQLTIHPHPFP